jgi:hypothetical protein
MPQWHSHETTELKLLFLNEGYAACLESDRLARQTGDAFRSKQRAQRAIMFLGEDPCDLTAGQPPATVTTS